MFNYDRLDQLVKETGKKKNYLSTKMGFSGRYLNDARKQNTDIKGEPLRILAEELGTTPEYLVNETDEKSPTPGGAGLTEAQKSAIELVKKMDEQTLARFVAAAKAMLGES